MKGRVFTRRGSGASATGGGGILTLEKVLGWSAGHWNMLHGALESCQVESRAIDKEMTHTTLG